MSWTTEIISHKPFKIYYFLIKRYGACKSKGSCSQGNTQMCGAKNPPSHPLTQAHPRHPEVDVTPTGQRGTVRLVHNLPKVI